ncbi:MAG: trehalase family glycosidase, partial [Bacteroidota bacterium]
MDEFRVGLRSALDSLRAQFARDQEFWSRCPVLGGDWPEAWKRGWVYDFETLRMNVRPPIGIFKHPWDAMQIHSPRVVLGETSLDMMTLSYADPALAKEVIYGTFADALAPNVPCAREDGSVNMISSDGSECGTAPMWGYPFHVIQSIYLSTADTVWIRNLYPYLKAYIEWWLAHRTDKEGWLHCNNSWESGQDGSKRFLVAERNEGAVADFVRTVDVEASMAEAMKTMELFAGVAGKSTDVAYWQTLAERRIGNTREMFFDGWFRDVDSRTKKPIILPDYYDVMMLSPLACGVATEDQVKAVRPMFQYFQANPGHWLEWPPHLITFTEAAWNAGMSPVASEVVAETADRVYGRTDAREVRFRDEGDRFSYRVPGVANEFWPVRDRLPGGENYGWGATLPMHIIRSIVGFREKENVSATEFFLAPILPKAFVRAGKRYVVRNLHYREVTFDVTYEFEEFERMKITFEYRSPHPTAVTVLSKSGNAVYQQKDSKKANIISFQ